MASVEWTVHVPIERSSISFKSRKQAMKHAYERSKELGGFTQYIYRVEGHSKEQWADISRSGKSTTIFVRDERAQYTLRADGTLGKLIFKIGQ